MKEMSAKAKSVIGLSLDQSLKQKLIDIASYLGKSMTSVIGSMITDKHNDLLGQVTVRLGEDKCRKTLIIELTQVDYDYLLFLWNEKDILMVTPFSKRDGCVANYVRDLIDQCIYFNKKYDEKEASKNR